CARGVQWVQFPPDVW
nr:immunoglobulin heavy chain junction region [Macaca mulatta]MOY25039.1 immunoglobulin heavy chain junction region [Macaca mulatta]MOY27787.1 immunoglobulin heavy chain junction region [Macaca mulatta]